MTTYSFEFADGRNGTLLVDDDNDAIQTAMRIVGPNAVHGDFEPYEGARRMLIWKTLGEYDRNDDTTSVAQLVAVQS